MEICQNQYFILCNGSEIKSLCDLGLLLDSLDDAEFSYHVNETKNDFANWARDVFGEEDLAEGLSACNDKKSTQIVLLKHLVQNMR
jgi:hypothetical protein